MSDSGLMRALEKEEGTIEFKVDAYRLFDGDENVLMASTGMVGVRLYRNGSSELRLDRVEPPDGTRSAVTDISGLEDYDYFRIFLSWSPSTLDVYIGPHPPVDGELRESTTQ